MILIEHFTGRFSNNSENIRTLLMNLRCKTLTRFRWYKDTFLSRIFEVKDCNNVYWKAKFIDGLPNLFVERIKKALRKDDSVIDYDSFTYGMLINACISEGLSLCNELSLKNQIKNQHSLERKQLGDFCDQFGMDTPSYKKKKRFSHEIFFTHRKDFRKRRKRHIDKDFKQDDRRDFKFSSKKKNINSSIICHKCGKVGHYASNCWTKKKINSLDIDQNVKDSFSKIFSSFRF